MERRTIPEAETKLVILYAMNRLGPVTGLQLLQFLVEFDLMNYFDLQLNLAEMEEQGQIAQHTHPLGNLLSVTDAGIYTLDAFNHRIPASKRTLIDQESPAWHDQFRLEQQTPADSYTLSDGNTFIRLQLMENDESMLEILLHISDESLLLSLQRRWRAAANDIYRAITESLGADYDATHPVDELPETAALRQNAHGDWLLELRNRPLNPDLTMVLSLPDEHLARHYAASWLTKVPALQAEILRLFGRVSY